MPELLHGGDVYTAREQGFSSVLDFSSNVNPLGPPASVTAAAARSLQDSCHYPDPLCRDLLTALARTEQVPASFLLCGAGAAELIYRYVYALRPRRALVTAPAFAEYEQALAAAGCRVLYHALREETQFMADTSLLKAITPDLDVLFLCNPHNPTGQLMDRSFLTQVLEACRRSGVRLVLDECFLDLLDNPEAYTLKPLLADVPELFLLKAFTKTYAIPGLRLGYGLSSDRALLDRMAQCGPPWSVSVPAQAAGLAALEETAYLDTARRYIRQERAFLQKGLEALNIPLITGRANYVFFKVPGCTDICRRMARRGILIRGCGNYRGLTDEFYRIAVRTHEENDRLLTLLGEEL